MITFQIDATYNSETGTPQMVKATGRVATPELAREIAAAFPKATKIRGGAISTSTGKEGYINLYAELTPNGSNRGVNETGLKRFRSFLKAAERLGHTVEYRAVFSNSYESMADFNDALVEASGEAFA